MTPAEGAGRPTFDPFAAPADDDLRGRAIRLATACAVVSQLLANPPSPLLAENLHEGAMTERWPLRDEVSLAAAAELAPAAHEPLSLQRADWDRLMGPGSPTRPLLSVLAPETPVPETEAGLGAPGHLALLPEDHAAVVLARTGSLATRATAPGSAPETAATFVGVVRTTLIPLTPPLVHVLREGAQSQAYQALGGLILGIRDQAASLAEDITRRAEA